MYILFRLFSLYILIFFAYGCSRTVNENDITDSIAPVAPRNTAVYWAKDGDIGIDWRGNPEPNVKGYNIYRSDGDTLHLRKISFTPDNYYIDDSLTYNITYYYRITAVNNQNLEGRMSEWVNGTPLNYNPPSVPRNLEINARNWNDTLNIFLKWKPGNESDIAGYRIYRGSAAGFKADSSTLAGFTSDYYFTDRKNLQLYKTYYYMVQAVDKGGLVSGLSTQTEDMLLEKSAPVFPADLAVTDYFTEFKIKAAARPAVYKIVVQSNPLFGEIWSGEISSEQTGGNISVSTAGLPFSAGSTYYWRIITYYNDNNEPNSISSLYNFTIKSRS
ncbi:MAG: fibronectin type III domain-containing protein [Syntrophothermus sp.]